MMARNPLVGATWLETALRPPTCAGPVKGRPRCPDLEHHKNYCPTGTVTVVANECTGQSESTSETDASAVMSVHPQVRAIFGAAEPNAEGAALAVKGKHVIVVGYDADPSAIQDLRTGVMSATIAHRPALEGQLGVEDIDDVLTGHKAAIKKSVQLPNVLITSADVRAGKLKAFYYPAG